MLLSPKRPVRTYTLPLALGLGLLVGVLWPYSPRFEDALNRAQPSALDPRVLIVAIDDATINDYGLIHHWPRSLHAQALETLEQAGAQVVGLDILFTGGGEQDVAVQTSFSRPNVVLATAPGDSRADLHPNWKAARGVSALNSGRGRVREIQTAYALPSQTGASTVLTPSFAAAVAKRAGAALPLTTEPRLLRYTPSEALTSQTISFRDLVSGDVRYADLQGRIVIVGQNASGIAGLTLPDIDGREVPGLDMQARAVSSLLQPPLQRLPLWLTVALCMLVAALTLVLGGLWGYSLAALTLLLSLSLWPLNIVFPGVAVSLSAVLVAGLVAFERNWTLKTLRMRDHLTGLGNRATFNRVLAQRWPTQQAHPFALALVDLSGFKRVNESQGRAAGDALLRDVAERLQRAARRTDQVFRWGADEFAVLMGDLTPSEAQAQALALEQALTPLASRGVPVQVNVGVAHAGEFTTPTELIEASSRLRYRAKYNRAQQN